MTKFVLSIVMMLFPVFLTPSSQNDNAFLSGLTTDTNSAQQQRSEMQRKKNAAQKLQAQELKFLENFYGNPKYGAAMLILNDDSLQEEYQRALNDLSFFFFEYTTKVLSEFHPSADGIAKAKSNSDGNISSFLASLQEAHSLAPKGNGPSSSSLSNSKKSSVSQPTTTANNQSSNANNAFLSNLEG